MKKPERYCKRGHDKWAPHGDKIERDYIKCAVCARQRNNDWMRRKRQKQRNTEVTQ